MNILQKLFKIKEQDVISSDILTEKQFNIAKVKTELCVNKIKRIMSDISDNNDDVHLNEWNKGRIYAYNILLDMLNSASAEGVIDFAKNKAIEIRDASYTVFSSGCFEVFRTWGSIDLDQLILKEKLLAKKNSK